MPPKTRGGKKIAAKKENPQPSPPSPVTAPVNDYVGPTTTTNPVDNAPMGNPPPCGNGDNGPRTVADEEGEDDVEKQSEGDERDDVEKQSEGDERDDLRDESDESGSEAEDERDERGREAEDDENGRDESGREAEDDEDERHESQAGESTESTEDRDEVETEQQILEEDSGDELADMQPLRMYFPPTEYKKKIKISTRCFYIDFLATLDSLEPQLTKNERKWFVKHPQFQHIFHLPKQGNHKLMGMWMLLMRTACIEKRKEVWFVVYGILIRYGLREHALMSGLDCGNYPVGYKKFSGLKFVRKHFGKSIVRVQNVKKKLEDMGADRDRLQMIVLYFLCSVLIGQTKTGNDATPVLDFFLRDVNDLDFCQSFPWGRLSYDHMVGEISHTIDHFKGVVKENKLWPIPGLCIPMELLAFQAIPELGNRFREPIEGAYHNFPRMCKAQFKSNSMRGFPLSRINEELAMIDPQSLMLVDPIYISQ